MQRIALLSLGLALLTGCGQRPISSAYSEFTSSADQENWPQVYRFLEGKFKRQIDAETQDMADIGEIAFGEPETRFAESCRKYAEFRQRFSPAQVVKEQIEPNGVATLELDRDGTKEKVTWERYDDDWRIVDWK